MLSTVLVGASHPAGPGDEESIQVLTPASIMEMFSPDGASGALVH